MLIDIVHIFIFIDYHSAANGIHNHNVAIHADPNSVPFMLRKKCATIDADYHSAAIYADEQS